MSEPCDKYEEDQFVCDDVGEPKGQCAHCGAKWYEHTDDALPPEERTGMKTLNEIREYQKITSQPTSNTTRQEKPSTAENTAENQNHENTQQ